MMKLCTTKTDDDIERQLVHALAHALVLIVSIFGCFSNPGAGYAPIGFPASCG